MHPADLLAGALLDQMGVHLQLALVLAQPLPILLHVGLLLRLEVDELDCAVLAANQVNAALEDVLILDQRNLDLGFLDAIPVAVLALVVAQHVQ
ncbi:hypothetical protein D9M69_279290 [compost metagenome]